MSTATTSVPQKLAILDDNLSISAPHFSHLDASQVAITIFTDTLAPFNHPSTSAEERQALIDRLQPFSIISTMRERTPFPADLLRRLPNLKLLLVTGTRHGTFDMAAAHELGIVVATAPGHGSNKKGETETETPQVQLQRSLDPGGSHPTTQHTWALILGLLRNVAKEDSWTKRGGWQQGFAMGTAGRTLGVVGLGRLGAAVARIGAVAFGMRVLCWSANLTQDQADQAAARLGLPTEVEGVAGQGQKVFKVVAKEELFRDADVVTLHYALSERSRGLVGERELASMKSGAVIVNTSRGPLIDEEALIDVLRRGAIRGAALDVFEVEPLPKHHPFRSFEWGVDGKSDLLLSPHMGYVEKENLDEFYAETADNVQRWISGQELLHRI
jgi:phosphoglycerate dehydrogenase-like enzyme